MAVLAVFAVSSLNAPTTPAHLDRDGGRQVFGSENADSDLTTLTTFTADGTLPFSTRTSTTCSWCLASPTMERYGTSTAAGPPSCTGSNRCPAGAARSHSPTTLAAKGS